jgi:hypothetical protein
MANQSRATEHARTTGKSISAADIRDLLFFAPPIAQPGHLAYSKAILARLQCGANHTRALVLMREPAGDVDSA